MSSPPAKAKIYRHRHRAKHGERMNAEQRERYRTDAEYRQSVIDRVHDYHEQFKDRINQERRERYQTDDEYRKKLKAQHAGYRERLLAGHTPTPRPIFKAIDGQSVRVYRISEASRQLGCMSRTVKRWYQHGWIPIPDIDGEKLLTASQIELLKLFYSIPKAMHDRRSECSKIIFECWGNSFWGSRLHGGQ